jgi:hypothetical protein
VGSVGEDVSTAFEDVKREVKKDPLVQDIIKNPVAAVGNYVTNMHSGGTVGMNSSGRIGMGAATRGMDEILGEVTGRNMQRQQIWENEQRLKQAQMDAQTDLLNSRKQAERDDMAASMAAGGNRATAYARSRRNLAWKALGQEEKDFLGI